VSYSASFYARTTDAAYRSAAAVVPIVAGALRPASVLDVGTGGGAWLRAWAEAGVGDLCGVDIAAREDSGFAVAASRFVRMNLDQPFDLGRRFSLVQSLEVAEHLPPESAADFVDSLCRHGEVVLFSAAPPGQGGTNHFNEQPYDYWRGLFAKHGYKPVDWLRRALSGRRDVAWWYRYNTLIYANDRAIRSFPAPLAAAVVSDTEKIEDVATVPHRLRRTILRSLPPWLIDQLAAAVDRVAARMQR